MAVGVMGAASAAGPRTGGWSVFYQGTLDGFGLHGLVHPAAVRGYILGSVTSPLIVVPFTLRARGRLRRAGVLKPARARDAVVGTALTAGVTFLSHAVARRIVAAR